VVDDWYALTYLALQCHLIDTPVAVSSFNALLSFSDDRTDAEVDVKSHAEKLEAFLSEADEKGWTLRPKHTYKEKVQKLGPGGPAGATGSPPKHGSDS
jgi:hypothetical protein